MKKDGIVPRTVPIIVPKHPLTLLYRGSFLPPAAFPSLRRERAKIVGVVAPIIRYPLI